MNSLPNERFQNLPPFTSQRGKSPFGISDLSEKLQSTITGDIYNVSAKDALQVLCFGMH